MAAQMVSRRRSLSDEEEALWSGVTRSITPLPHAKKRPKSQDQATVVVTRTAVSKPRAVHEVMPAVEKPQPPLAPLDRRTKQRIASGRTQKEAHAALSRFLKGAQAAGAKVALVVTGKGTARSRPARGDHTEPAEPGVLRRQVPIWLSLPEFRPLVVSVEDAHIAHGGQGALYVRLRRGR